MRTHLTLTKEDDVLSPDLSRPPIEPNMCQRKLERRRNDRTSLLRLVEVGRVDRVDTADVVEIEAPEIDGGGGAEGACEEVFDAGEEVVGEFEVAVTDPLLSLRNKGKSVRSRCYTHERHSIEGRGREGVGTGRCIATRGRNEKRGKVKNEGRRKRFGQRGWRLTASGKTERNFS
jgi:hypothetical protein